MCCRNRKLPEEVEEASKRSAGESKPETFQQLVESVEVNLTGPEELRKRKQAILSMAEWKTPNKANMKKIKDRSSAFIKELMSQVKVMSDGLKTLIIINTRIENAVTQEIRIKK